MQDATQRADDQTVATIEAPPDDPGATFADDSRNAFGETMPADATGWAEALADETPAATSVSAGGAGDTAG
ncbi:MAG: hypothetical protein AVDCRST_MAG49-4544 [uncultured Thermomicrobiales bacterium]|uniref:Uncharacterized protein n=1 Tax=uncultured Thermomicrobiales bacterium TaxID=1645740 RepID=A0A6J4VH78_9BACT|nr:MAG: hypothetical protein AVDCRST_MAG49-4544 [uncultured Thermomicrobiales bacterium]